MSQSISTGSDSLWQDRNFLTLWTGQALSAVGAQLTQIAVPVIAVLLLHATEFEVGMLSAASVVAFLVIGLPAGAWIDRMYKRRVMIWADLVRAMALAVVPVLWLAGVLHMWHLYVVALVIGVATVFFDVSYQSLIPSLVSSGQIGQANAKLEGTLQIARLAGPALGGGLVGLISAPVTLLATVVTYLGSIAALRRTRDSEQISPAPRRPIYHEIVEGLRWVLGNRILRTIVVPVAASGLFANIATTLFPVLILRELAMSSTMMGLLLSLGAIGGLLAALTTRWLVRQIGESRILPLSAGIWGVTSLLLPLAGYLPSAAFSILVVQGFVMSYAIVAFNIQNVTFRQRITPQHLLGRMNASVRFMFWGVLPIGALLAGVLATWLGTVTTLLLAAVAEIICLLPLIFGPFWSRRDLPASPKEAMAEEKSFKTARDQDPLDDPAHFIAMIEADHTRRR
ncbi:Predicted arabinose efflux permease, MFS family [Micrococcales bacterium KH10]|nr:Predicted arabinose efflux permease, MFS family [Micrococcales bacterium KH10]